MPERRSPPPSSLAPFGLLGLALLLAGQWLFLDRLERTQAETLRASREAELRQLLPVLRGRSNPVFLAEEFLYANLGHLLSGTRQGFRRFERELRRAYGNEVAFALWDGNGEGRLLRHRHFQPVELDILHKTMGHQYHRETNSWKYAEDHGIRLRQMLGNASLMSVPDNFTNFAEVTMHGRRGALFFALVPPRRLNQSMREALYPYRGAPPNTLPEVRARVAVFLPQRQLTSRRCLVRALRSRSLVRSLPVRIGPARDPSLWLRGSGISPDRLRQILPDQDQGVFVTDTAGLAFIHLSDIPGWVMVHLRRFPPPIRLARTPWMLGLTAAWVGGLLVLGWIGWFQPWRWTASITRKFLTLVLLATFLPSLGMLWIAWTRSRLEANLQELTLFRQAEAELEAMEQSLNQQLQAAVAAARRFLRRPDWRAPVLPSRAAIASAVLDLGIQGAGTVYLVARGHPEVLTFSGELILRPGEPRPPASFATKIGPPKGVVASASSHPTAKMTPLATALLHKVGEHFGFVLAEPGPPRKDVNIEEVRGGVLYEFLEAMVGKDSMLRMVVQTGRLLPFRMLHEVAWAMLEVTRDADRQPHRLFLLIFRREEIQFRNFIARASERHLDRGPFPRLILMNTLAARSSPHIPEWADVFPLATVLLRQAFREQGVQRLILPKPALPAAVGGHRPRGRLLAIARPLKGTDFVAVALRRQPEDDPADPIAVAAVLAGLYPLLIAGLAILFFQRIFLRPVRALQEGVATMAGGQYDVRLPVTSDDELGQLCSSFNRMADGVREKEFLRRFLSDLALEAVEGGQTARATRATGTVIMADIRGFTALAEEHPPEAVVDMLNAYLTVMEVAIEKHAGTIEKFIGDAIFAVFLPMHGRDTPERRAAQAGLDMLKALGRFNRDRQRRGLFTISCGVGIATGELLMGLVGGADGRREFTVTGPTVNRAAAMEKVTKRTVHTKLVVCPLTASRLGEGWTIVPLPTAPGQPPDAYEIGRGASA
jgi:class 3 adenylate cyclase